MNGAVCWLCSEYICERGSYINDAFICACMQAVERRPFQFDDDGTARCTRRTIIETFSIATLYIAQWLLLYNSWSVSARRYSYSFCSIQYRSGNLKGFLQNMFAQNNTSLYI